MYEKPRKAIRTARDIRGLTQESLAERTNYSVDSIRRWESGMTPAAVPAIMELEDKMDVPWLTLLYMREQYGDGFLRGIVPDFTPGLPLAITAAQLITCILDLVDKRFDRELLRMVADGRIDEIEQPVYEQFKAETWKLMGAGLDFLLHGEEPKWQSI